MAILIGLIPPIIILAIGWFGYTTHSVEPAEKKEKGKRKPIKTQVVELEVQDYPTSILTQGNSRPHNVIPGPKSVSVMSTMSPNNNQHLGTNS